MLSGRVMIRLKFVSPHAKAKKAIPTTKVPMITEIFVVYCGTSGSRRSRPSRARSTASVESASRQSS